MSRIFVSYSREDQGLVRTLVEDIEALGHSAWFDEELSGGQVWWDEVLNQIRTCDVFVLAVSAATISSTACKREYGYAEAVGKPVVPVVVTEGVSPNLLPPALSRVQLVLYLRQDRNEALRLARAIGSLPPARPLPDPMPPTPDVPISYLGQLTEKIESLSALNYDEQSALLLDLRRGIQDPETRDDSRTLLERLRKRRDLFAAIAEEIDLMVRVARPVSTPAMAATPSSVGVPAMAAGVLTPAFGSQAAVLPLLVDLHQPAAPAPANRTVPAATDSSSSVPRVITLLITGPLGWLVTFRRSLRHVVMIIAATAVLLGMGSVFLAKGDGVDGYSDDAWEYLGALLMAASWWWPFAFPSYRAGLRGAAASTAVPLEPAPPALARQGGTVVLANAFLGMALVFLVVVWIGLSLDADDEFSAVALMENLPTLLAVSAFCAAWAICSRGWANTSPVASERGDRATLRSALVLFRPTRPAGWMPIVSWHLGLALLVVLVVALLFDPEPMTGDVVLGLLVGAVALVGYLTAARGWALAFRRPAPAPPVVSAT